MYKYPVTVEFEDIDSYGIMHHPKPLYYFERARAKFFFDNGLNLNDLRFGLVLRNLNIKYKNPLLLMDKLIIELKSKNIEKLRFVFEYSIKKDDKLYVYSEIEFCVIDLSTKKLIEIPETLIKVLEIINE